MQIRSAIVSVLAVLVLTAGCATQQTPAPKAAGTQNLARQGKTNYVIVVADDASPSTKHAAEELAAFLKEISGAEFPIRSDKEPIQPNEIILGDNAHLRQVDAAIDLAPLGQEGYILRTVGPQLLIAGGALRGNLYGVYGLLEDHFGCRWYTPEISHIPRQTTLSLPELNETRVPVFEYREPFVIDCQDGNWCARNRVNSSAGALEAQHGGKVKFGAGMFVHTFNTLVPPETHFATHPEYFSEVEGKRLGEKTQLCCTNEEVVQICINEVRRHIQEDPEAVVYSVSQNDWGNYCCCAKCKALADAEGSQMGPVLQLVNRVAEVVEKEFPGKYIETLAYQYTRKPPATLRPRPNVIIRLCSIECCFMHPLEKCSLPANQAFCRDAQQWAAVAVHIWVWDYVTSFRHYMVPFPNLYLLNDNIKFFQKNKVKGIFEQDNYQSPNGEFSALGGYMIAKFLWNPDYNEDVAMNEFLDAVYGPKSGRFIRQYIDLLQSKVQDPNMHANIWVGPRNARYLTDDVLVEAARLWDKAEENAPNADARQRIRIARLPLEYAWIEQNRDNAFTFDHANGMAVTNPEFIRRTTGFLETAKAAGVIRLDESTTTLDDYAAGFKETLQTSGAPVPPLDPVTPPLMSPGLNYAYYEGEWDRLPDFAALAPVKSGIAYRVDLGLRNRQQGFALRYTGFFKAPETGVYCFHLASNDGSRMKIGPVVVDNDGLHAGETKSALIALKKGMHPLEICYFQAGGESELAVTCVGPGIERKMLPGAMLFH